MLNEPEIVDRHDWGQGRANGPCPQTPFVDFLQSKALFGSRDTLLTIGLGAVLSGLLLPMPAFVFDLVLVFNLSLAAAVVLVSYSARSALQVQGLPLLIVLLACLGMAVSIESSKLILLQGDTGKITYRFGNLILRDSNLFSILVAFMLVPLCFGTVSRLVKSIRQTAREFVLGTEERLKTNTENTEDTIFCKTDFFVGMASAGRFLLVATIIQLLIVFANIVGGVIIWILRTSESQSYVTQAVSSGVMLQGATVITALACRFLVKRSFAAEYPVMAQSSVKVKDTNESIIVEATEPAEADIHPEPSPAKIVPRDVRWCDEDEQKDTALWSCDLINDSYGYKTIAKLTEEKLSPRTKVLVMAGENSGQPVVTIPVNIAIRLAKRKSKCLLIDLDLERNAISKVFDIDKEAAKPVRTSIENLWVLPICDLADMEKIKKGFDCVIMYAPNIKSLKHQDLIAGHSQLAMLFGDGSEGYTKTAMNDFCSLFEKSGCEILNPDEILAEAV